MQHTVLECSKRLHASSSRVIVTPHPHPNHLPLPRDYSIH
jgi:hypothetical protein